MADKIKYLKLVLLTPLVIISFFHLLSNILKIHLLQLILCSFLLVFLGTIYYMNRSKNVYLVDFACFKPEPAHICSTDTFLKIYKAAGLSEENQSFQKKIVEKSGLGEKTYFPESLLRIPATPFLEEARKEAELLLFGAVDDLFAKASHVKVHEIGIVVANCSLFSPTPSLSAAVVNRYGLRSSVLSYNLSGMGCSTGITSIDLAKNLLKVQPNCYALIVSAECGTLSRYLGNNRSMLVTNCIFRMGGTAVLLANNSSDRSRSKYQLLETVRTHKGANDNSYTSVIQQEDDEPNKKTGIELSKKLTFVAGEALKTNISTLGPLVLPFSEQSLYLSAMFLRRVFKMKIKPYVPDFKHAFEHFCVHPGGKTVLDEVEKKLELTEWHMEPSRMSLFRFGNTSSCSVWYELAYCEAKGRIKKDDRVWQLGFGSGFKCNSAVWKALRSIDPSKEMKNPWMDEINEFPVHFPKVEK